MHALEAAPSKPHIRPLLPTEPRIVNREKESRLTEEFLVPKLPALEAMFWAIRSGVDPELAARQPVKLGKPYPLGQCLEIAKAVEHQVKHIDPSMLSGLPLQGLIALRSFLRQGGTMRQAWGDLRGAYFQNAFVVGTLYVDCSNDTVVATKPKIEILPFDQADFRPVEDFGHFARIAQRYWKATVFPNHLLPVIAPYAPMIVAIPNGQIQFQFDSDYMIGLATTTKFQLSRTFLEAAPFEEALFGFMKKHLPSELFKAPADPVQGRKQALDNCRIFREKRWHLSPQERARALATMRRANRYLAAIRVTPEAN
jgi:hypothetical protein